MVSDDGNSLPKTVECHIENEDKDIGWAYCSFVGHCFSEAVSITAVKGPIESIEWGRPHSFEGRFKRCINAMFHYQCIDMDIYQIDQYAVLVRVSQSYNRSFQSHFNGRKRLIRLKC